MYQKSESNRASFERNWKDDNFNSFFETLHSS